MRRSSESEGHPVSPRGGARPTRSVGIKTRVPAWRGLAREKTFFGYGTNLSRTMVGRHSTRRRSARSAMASTLGVWGVRGSPSGTHPFAS